MNDLWHALILIGLLMAFFAGIGNWRFGSSRQDFSSFMAAMGTEFQVCMTVVNFDGGHNLCACSVCSRPCPRADWHWMQMMFGEFPVEWNATAELQMFIIIYFIVIFVFVLNFLLAIIVGVCSLHILSVCHWFPLSLCSGCAEPYEKRGAHLTQRLRFLQRLT